MVWRITIESRSFWQWWQSVQQGGEDVDDKVRPVRQPIDFLGIRTLTLFDEKPFHSAYSIDGALGISHNYLERWAGIAWCENFSLMSDPTPAKRQFTRGSSGNLLGNVTHSQAHEEDKFRRFLTGDKSWFTLESIISRNGANRAMTSLKRANSKSQPKKSFCPLCGKLMISRR
jgi:hypothetical protein